MKFPIRSSRPGADVKSVLALLRAGDGQLNATVRSDSREANGPRPRRWPQRLLGAPATVWLGMALLALHWGAQGAPADKNAKAEPAAKAPAAAVETEIPQSVFVIPAGPREGRNPFFPHSTAAQPVQKAREAMVDTSSIVLNGITARPIPLVMINGVTFGKGEEHELKVPTGGKVKVRCEAIRQDSAVILVNGLQQCELRLRSGL